MRRGRHHALVPAAGSVGAQLVALVTCTVLVATATTSGASTRLTVDVRANALTDRALHVRMTLEDWPDSSLVLRAVPSYLDNPTALADGRIVEELVVRDGEGRVLALENVELEGGEAGWRARGAPGRYEWSYRISIRFVDGPQVRDYAIRIPFMDPRSAWLIGNHIFIAPELTGPRWLTLRAPTPVQVRFSTPPSLPVVGPPPGFELPNLHCLLSLQFGLGRFEVIQSEDPARPWTIVLDAGAAFTPQEKQVLVRRTAEMTARAAALFSGVPFPRLGLYVFRRDGLGGLEGAHVAQAYLPPGVDLADPSDPFATMFFRVAMHEFVHAWLPIALFGVDDPWLKEGVTSFYGEVLAARAGWLLPKEIEDLFVGYPQTVFGDVILEPVTLSDSQLWWREYDGENWRRVTYDRGRAVALLLDLHLRERTRNHHSLDDVMKVLYARHLHAAFDRQDLLEAIRDATGIDAAGFFARYVESTAAPSASEVRNAHLRAIELGVYRIGHASEAYTEVD